MALHHRHCIFVVSPPSHRTQPSLPVCSLSSFLYRSLCWSTASAGLRHLMRRAQNSVQDGSVLSWRVGIFTNRWPRQFSNAYLSLLTLYPAEAKLCTSCMSELTNVPTAAWWMMLRVHTNCDAIPGFCFVAIWSTHCPAQFFCPILNSSNTCIKPCL